MSTNNITSKENALKRRNCDDIAPEMESKRFSTFKMIVSRKPTLVELSLGDMVTFPKQREAVEELLAKRPIWKDDLRIFSYELKGGSGERRYLVTTIKRFWKWYNEQKERHMYEVIYEDMPCRLYFDLEYSKECNPDVNHSEVYHHFLLCLKESLLKRYNITLDPEKDLIVLESSTNTKFSAHIICHFTEDILFPSSTSIRQLSDVLTQKLLENPPHKLFNSDGKEVPLFDSTVYSKNRNFRMFLSSKLGKSTILELADYCKFYELRGQKKTDENIFMDSLCVPPNYEKYRILDKKLFEDQTNYKMIDLCASKATIYTSGPAQKSSPLPYIDDFIEMILKKWTPDAQIRSWKVLENDGKISSIIYYPGNCRYCFNIGREHKKNKTYWTVDIEKGYFYQKCFDFADCKGKSSNFFPLPDFITKQLSKKEDEKEALLEHTQIDQETFFSNWDSVFDC